MELNHFAMLSNPSSFAIIFALINFADGDPCELPENITIKDCSSTAYLYTPNPGRNYEANLNCTWTLTVPASCPTGMVAFFDWLSTDCSDSVHISRGPHRLATWSGVSRSNNAFNNSPCQQLAPSRAIYLSNKYSPGSATQLTIQLQSSSSESQFRQGFTVSFTAIALTNQSFGSNVDDAFILTETSALISTSDQLNNSSTSEANFLESFILPSPDSASDISLIGNGQMNDSVSVMCLPPPIVGVPQIAQLVKRFQGSDNGSMTLCVRPAIVVRRTWTSGNASTRGIVANYFATTDNCKFSSNITIPMPCQQEQYQTTTTAIPKSSPNFRFVTCLFIYINAALTIVTHNLMRS